MTMTMTRVCRHFAAHLRARRASVSSPPRARAACAVDASRASARARRAGRGARRSTWRLLGRRRRARRLLMLTSGTHGVEGFCGSGCQVALPARRRLHARGRTHAACASCSCTRSIRMASRMCGGRTRTTSTSIATSAISAGRCRPNTAYAEVHDFMVPAHVAAARRRTRARLRAYVQRAAQRALQAAVSGGQCEFPTASSTAACGRRGATACCATCCATHAAHARSASAGSTSTPGSARAGTARRSTPAATSLPIIARSQAAGGATTSRRSTTARRRRRSLTGVNYAPPTTSARAPNIAGIALEYGTVPLAETLAGAARRPVAAQPSRRRAGAARGDQARDARRVPRRCRRLEAMVYAQALTPAVTAIWPCMAD